MTARPTAPDRSAPRRARYDAVVVGAGPNGLSAAIVLAHAGLEVLVVERAAHAGGGARSGELTLPGFVHDLCSAIHPLGVGSPLFRRLGLERFGLEWVQPASPLAHVRRDGSAVLLERSVEQTAAALGGDGDAYRALLGPFVDRFEPLARMVLGPLRSPTDPLLLARFGLAALQSLHGLVRRRFRDPAAAALLAGLAAHSMLPLDAIATASFAILLASAGHAVGWPLARGGSQAIVAALGACLEALGGEIVTGWPVRDLGTLPYAHCYLLDVTPRQVLAMDGLTLPRGYRERLARFRYGPGVFKMDWALRGPVPWKDPRCSRAATVHLIGDAEDVAAAERAVSRGAAPPRPFVLFVQPAAFDATRAPAGAHIGWAYCHAPNGSEIDLSEAIEAQVERSAPGFRALVLARHARTPVAMQRYNPNYVGGDINGGRIDVTQLFTRPVARLDPYGTPDPHVFLCSSSTPPGGGVHGMCGYFAAASALRRVFGRAPLPLA